MLNSKLEYQNPKQRSGFTLMEVVVVMLIFTLASIIIAEIFVNIYRAQQRTRNLQSAYTDSRYLLEIMAREIRSGTIDYSTIAYPTGINTPEEELHLVTSQGASLVFRHNSGVVCGNVDCVTIERDGGGENIITSPKLQIDKLEFYISPLTNPFPDTVTSLTEDVQPQVTIVLKTTSTSIKVEERTSTYLQTTVSSRAYLR